MKLRVLLAANLLALTVAGCASLEGLRALIQPPQFEQARDRPSEIRLLSLRGGVPGGLMGASATVRLWTNVTNPNPFGLTLSTVQATLLIEGIEVADVDFPLGLPLQARQSDTIPLDLTVSTNVPRLADALASGGALSYRLEGTVGIDAGRFGQPSFGPMTLLTGDLLRHF